MKARILLLTFIFCCLHVSVFATTKTSTGSGNWTTGGTWSPSSPASGDSIVIDAGHTVTVSSNVNLTGFASAVKIHVIGVLTFFGGGAKLRLPAGSIVTVASGGQITSTGGGGAAGKTLEAGGATIWVGTTGTVSGPQTISQAAPLPVTWLSFNAKRAGETSINLKWSTASEINNSHFEVERSADAKNFTVIGNVKGNGTTSQVSNYTYTDASGLTGSCYYRLRQVDLNGKSEYSIIIAVPASAKTVAKQTAGTNIVSLNPNPVVDMAELRVKGYENVNANIQVVDMSGMVLKDMMMLLGTESSPAMIDLGFLKTGSYIIKVTPEGNDKAIDGFKFMKK